MNLFKVSASGNRFLIADFRQGRSAKKSLVKKYEPIDTKIFSEVSLFLTVNQSYEDFCNLSALSQEERKVFFKSLTEQNEVDGFSVLKPSEEFLFESDFYNRDGSQAQMCGNLSCCLIFYAQKSGLTKENQFSFKIEKEEITALREGEKYWSFIKSSPWLKEGESYLFEGKQILFDFVKVGVPHGVLREENWDLNHMKALAKKLRQENRFECQGMNVSFFSEIKPNCLKARTFERGVEDWTQACGTGALSVALSFAKKNPELKELQVQMPGGLLEVKLKPSLALFSQPKWGYE